MLRFSGVKAQVCFRVLQSVAECCSVSSTSLRAVCCVLVVLQGVAVCRYMSLYVAVCQMLWFGGIKALVRDSSIQCDAVCCMCCTLLVDGGKAQVCCSVWRWGAVCCSVLHVAVERFWIGNPGCVTLICVTWRMLTHMCDMTHAQSYMWHDACSLICVTWRMLTHMCDMTHAHSYVWHDTCSLMYVTWRMLTHVCDMTHAHSYVWHDTCSLICVTWRMLTHMRDMTHAHSYVWHDACSLICVTWHMLTHMCDMTHAHSYAWHDTCSLICVTWHMHKSDTSCDSCPHVFCSFVCVTSYRYSNSQSGGRWCYEFIRLTWLIHMYRTVRDLNSRESRVKRMFVTRDSIYIYIYVWHDWYTCTVR